MSIITRLTLAMVLCSSATTVDRGGGSGERGGGEGERDLAWSRATRITSHRRGIHSEYAGDDGSDPKNEPQHHAQGISRTVVVVVWKKKRNFQNSGVKIWLPISRTDYDHVWIGRFQFTFTSVGSGMCETPSPSSHELVQVRDDVFSPIPSPLLRAATLLQRNRPHYASLKQGSFLRTIREENRQGSMFAERISWTQTPC
jgi:hypothetical protein